MKVFLVSNMYPSQKHPDYGVFVKNFRTSLESLGISFPQPCLLKGRSNGLKKLWAYLKYYTQITKRYLNKNYNVVYIHFISHNAPIFYLLLLLFGKKAPIVINVHGSDVITYNSGLFGFFNKKLVRKVDRIVVPSDYFSTVVLQKFPLFDKKNIIINPSGGIDLGRFYPIENEKANTQPTLGFVSRIDEGKGWETFVQVVGALHKKNLLVNGIMVGTGGQVNQMVEYIDEKGLTNKIKYIGVVEQKELVNVYNNMDLFIFPSIREAESLGLVGLEAMACGVPIIAFDKAGAKTYTKDRINGFLCAPGDIEEVVQCTQEFFTMKPSERDKMKKNALDTAQKYGKLTAAKSIVAELHGLDLIL